MYDASQILKNFKKPETEVSEKYTDKNNVNKLFNTLNLEANEKNKHFAEILEMEKIKITPESMSALATIYDKIDDITKKLHPKIVFDMLKKGLNPLNMYVDDIIKYINRFSGVYEDDLQDKISDIITKMDKNKELNFATKMTIIDFYKSIDSIKKSDSIAAYLYKEKLKLEDIINYSENLKKIKHRKVDYLVEMAKEWKFENI